MPTESPARVSQGRFLVLLAAREKAAGVELGRVRVNIRIHVDLVDVEGSKGTLWYDLSCASDCDILTADVLAESRPHRHDSDAFVKTQVGEGKVMLPVINAHRSEDMQRALLRAGSVLGNRTVDFGAYLVLPVGIQSEEAKDPGRIVARVQLSREDGEDDELQPGYHS